MAQQMRVRDQDIIVKKVVNALDEKGLQDLKDKFGNASEVRFLEGEVKKLSTLNEKIEKLNTQSTELQKSINRKVEDFNLAQQLDGNNNGLVVNTYSGRYNNSDNKIYFEFSTDWSVRSEIADALALQTLGSDFNVQDLIASLIAEFS